jgi:hypothetical protein
MWNAGRITTPTTNTAARIPDTIRFIPISAERDSYYSGPLHAYLIGCRRRTVTRNTVSPSPAHPTIIADFALILKAQTIIHTCFVRNDVQPHQLVT